MRNKNYYNETLHKKDWTTGDMFVAMCSGFLNLSTIKYSRIPLYDQDNEPF